MSGKQTDNKGKLIALEGLDGVGKTTQADFLARYLGSLELPVILTREPTDGVHGQQIRRIIEFGRQGLTPAAELALFVADRMEHVQQVILPALAAGYIIITDRYYFSSMAYQGALGFDPQEILHRHENFAPPPDLVIVLELPLGEVFRRLQQRGRLTSFENLEYLAKVAKIFEHLDASGLVRVNGLGTASEVSSKISAVISQFLDLPPKQELTGGIDSEVI